MPDSEQAREELTAFIDDGFTQEGYIAGVERLHPPLSFSFRPMTHADTEKFVALAAREGSVMADTYAKFIEKHVVSWSLSRPCKQAIVCRLRPSMLKKLFGIVSGGVPSDPLPTSTGDDDNEGKTASETDEAAVKN